LNGHLAAGDVARMLVVADRERQSQSFHDFVIP